MSDKLKVETQFLDMATALVMFEDAENLLTLLREGTLVAYGRSDWAGAGPNDCPGPMESIPSTVWHDYRFVPGPNLLTDDYENFYCAIQLRQDDVLSVTKANAGAIPSANKGGRPPRYKWERIMPEIFLKAYEEHPQTLDGWVRQARKLDIYGDAGVPDESTLRKLLKDYLHRL